MSSKDKWTYRDPHELLTHKRFDVVIKYLYAKNQSSHYYRKMYKEHLWVWNHLSERDPPKNGLPQFEKAFRAIIDNTAATPPIPVNNKGHIPNGAHRLAAALYHQRPIKVRAAASNEQYPVISDHKLFVRKDLPMDMLGRTAVEYAKLKTNTHVICLFPIVHTKYWDAMRIIEKHVNIFYVSTESLNPVGQLGLMKEIYLREGWSNEAGIKRKSDQCFADGEGIADKDRNRVTFVLVDAKNLETVKEMKAKIRELFNVGNHSVHVSDFHEDCIRICKTIFNQNSIHFLNNRKYVSFPNYTRLLADIKPDDNKVISGSAVLSLYGLRDCKDIDFIYNTETENAPIDAHNQYIGTHYGKPTLDCIMNDPHYHLYYQGFKYVALNTTKAMKRSRNEPKDIKDIKLIEQLGPQK